VTERVLVSGAQGSLGANVARAALSRAFLAEARRQTGHGRVLILPSALVRVGALAVPLAREFADILHLWEAPVLLDGAKLRARFPATRFTPYADGIAETLAGLRENPGVRMYF